MKRREREEDEEEVGEEDEENVYLRIQLSFEMFAC